MAITPGNGPVRIPASQLRPDVAQGDPLTAAHVGICLMAPLQYFDENGDAHNDVFFVVGDAVYKPRDSEAWAAGWGVVKKALAEEVKAKLDDQFKKLVTSVVREVLRKEGRVAPTSIDTGIDVIDDAATEVLSELGTPTR